LAEIDAALAGVTGELWFDAGLHRIRGEIILKQNLANPPPPKPPSSPPPPSRNSKRPTASNCAPRCLAKLYQSTGRPIDAHDVLGPALDGFSPTPEFPEIAEAKALFDALAHL
jgi:hypothetical protein